MSECGRDVFPDHPEWGEIQCSRPPGHTFGCARFDVPAKIDAAVLLRQALVLLDQSGSENQWLTWAAETREWLRELNEA